MGSVVSGPRFSSASTTKRFLFFSRSEEHTSELQSLRHLVCRLLFEKNKTTSFLLPLLPTSFRDVRALHAFPTRRSSDLVRQLTHPQRDLALLGELAGIAQ